MLEQDLNHIIKNDFNTALTDVVLRLAYAAREICGCISKRAIDSELGEAINKSTHGDEHRRLDAIADDIIADGLAHGPVNCFASEERQEVQVLSSQGPLAVAVVPLAGSSNMDINLPIGTIFSVYPAVNGAPEASILRPGRDQICAGYFIYGPQTSLVLGHAGSVRSYTLETSTGQFCRTRDQIDIQAEATEFAINPSNYRHWDRPVRAYINDCLAGKEGPRQKDFNTHWNASLVSEVHWILNRGGVFLYPADARQGYEAGWLRMVFEANPMAFLVENAGGRAIDGTTDILDKCTESLHERTPLVLGSREEVNRIARYFSMKTLEGEYSPLFVERGLLRD